MRDEKEQQMRQLLDLSKDRRINREELRKFAEWMLEPQRPTTPPHGVGVYIHRSGDFGRFMQRVLTPII